MLQRILQLNGVTQTWEICALIFFSSKATLEQTEHKSKKVQYVQTKQSLLLITFSFFIKLQLKILINLHILTKQICKQIKKLFIKYHRYMIKIIFIKQQKDITNFLLIIRVIYLYLLTHSYKNIKINNIFIFIDQKGPSPSLKYNQSATIVSQQRKQCEQFQYLTSLQFQKILMNFFAYSLSKRSITLLPKIIRQILSKCMENDDNIFFKDRLIILIVNISNIFQRSYLVSLNNVPLSNSSNAMKQIYEDELQVESDLNQLNSLFINMKPGVFLCLALLLSCVSSEALQLYSVSSSSTKKIAPQGSIRGGTAIFINGVGFDTSAANNQVFIGPYPCIVPAKGATPTVLSCVTTDTKQNNDIYNLPIIVTVNGIQQSLTNEQGCFSYINGKTPLITELFPASSHADTSVNFYGIHRITYLGDGNRDVGDVISMKIGDTLCGRFDIPQLNISANSGDTISCKQALVQRGGKYFVQEHLTPGYSVADPKLRRSSILQESYHFAVLPAIKSFTPNSGALAGQKLNIQGTGFSTDSSQITVTVDGTPCNILTSTQTSISCDLQARTSASSLLSTNSQSQVNGYISGTGLNYKRYSVTNLATKTNIGFRAAVKANSAQLTLQQSSYRGEIKSGNYYGSNYGQAFTGYFTAPVSGRYVFRGVADDTFALYLSSTYGSEEAAVNPLIYSNSYQHYSNFYINYNPTAEGAANLQAGKSYYIQVYHLNYGGSGHLRVQVQIPNSDTTLLWQTHAVQKLDLTFTNDPQVLNFTLTGASAGQVNLKFVLKPGGGLTYTLSTIVPFNASISQFLAALNTLQIFSPYQISGQRFTYDSNGQISTTSISTYSWIVSVKYLRTMNHTKATLYPTYTVNTGSPVMTLVTVRPHGQIITGAFLLNIGSIPVQHSPSNQNLRSNMPWWELQYLLRMIPGFELVEVNVISNTNYMSYGATWLISFIGYNGPVPLFVTDNSNLFGGVLGTKPQITATELRAYSSDILIGAIDYPFLGTPSPTYNVLIKVNGVPSVCLGTCTYTYLSSSPQLTSASISSSTLTLSLTDPAVINYSLKDTTVTLAGQPCTIGDTTQPISNFQCSLPANTDSTPIITAGSYTPLVTVKQVGLVPAIPSVTAFAFPLSLTTLSLTSGGSNGGYSIILQGTGFPLISEMATITICGQSATIQSISNIQAKIIVPSCATLGNTQVTISDGPRTSNGLTFTYNSPTPTSFIYTVVPQTHNPTLKGTLEITGLGFGTDLSKVRVDLANSSGKVYKMRILKLNDTYIKAGIPGGLAGKYNVQVNLIGIGQALPSNSAVNDFTYELVITSVTPATGSYNGGTLLDIVGINFSTAMDETLVFVGNELNWMCNVQSVTATNIKCRTPPINPEYLTGVAQTVTLTNRLMADNTCQGTCSFTYIDKSSSPTLSSISMPGITTGTIYLVGTNLNSGGSPKVILTNKKTSKVTSVTPASATDTSISFNVPSIEAGTYDVKVRNDPLGETNSYQLIIYAQINAKTPASLSTQGGKFTITGTGLPETWPNPHWILIFSKNKVFTQSEVLQTSATAIVFNIPACSDKDLFNATFITPTGSTIGMTLTASSASTPAISLTTSSSIAAGSNSFSFTQTTLTSAIPDYVEVFSIYNPSEFYKYSVTASAGIVQFSATLAGGKYGFRFFYSSYGWSNCPSIITVTIASPTAPTLLQSSYKGGSFVLSGANLSPSGTVKINGVKTTLTNINANSATAIIPPFVTANTQAKFGLVEPTKLTRSQYQIFSDNAAEQTKAFDNLFGTVYTSPSVGDCFIGFDIGSDLVLELTRIRFFPNSRWTIASQYLVGATFQASNDNSSWTTFHTIDATVRSGWNILPFSLPNKYRYYRFAHNVSSQCSLAEIEITGVTHSTRVFTDYTSNPSQITYEDGGNFFTLSNTIEFREDRTPIVNTLSRLNGDVFGTYSLTLTGVNLNFATPTVTIDGISCAVTASSSTSITCTVGSRLSLPTQNSFVVLVGSSIAILKQTFSYVMRWSDIRTWGTDMPPIDNDLVFVPKGMNLLVDQTTPKLQGILVENGTLTFSDEIDMEVHAGFITVDGGKLIAGTQQKPYAKKLTFVLYGGYYTPQQPMFGNKGIGCMECFISIFGQVRSYTWSMLESSATVGSSSLTVQDPVDWRVGQEIVVASTNFDHNEAERRKITAISGKTITVDAPFKFLHFAGVETYGLNDKIQMRAEVGLLTRNIKVMGDETSEKQNYGAHLMMAGSAQNGLVGQIAYTQFTKCGQPRIIGRYCIHFHMNGDVTESFARGNAVHDSMARVITLHGVHYLTVEKNVGYNVKGHNFFIQDGIETHNLLQYNLAISSIQVWTMLQTDISVASFWVTNPTNHFRYNHAAGSDFYGFWYEIKTNPDGPSACGDVCPIGNPLGDCHDNVAHSNVRFGLRIFKLAPRTYPCQALSNSDTVDPWATNPGIVGTFANYTLYKNGQSGLLAEQTAYLIFDNITSAQNKRAGAQFWISYFSKDPPVLRNSIIIGQTIANSPQPIPGGNGVITPRDGHLKMDNIRFYNFPANTQSIQTCAHCDDDTLFTNTAQQVYISKITFTNVSGYKLFMNGAKRQILYDLDGSFTTTAFDGTQRQSAAIVYNYPHLASDPACLPTSNTNVWDNTIACDQSVKLIRVTFNKLQPVSLFMDMGLKAQPLADLTDVVSETSTSFTQLFSYFSQSKKVDAMKTAKKTYAMPYIAGKIYNIWWHTGLDFDHLSVSSSYYMKPTDPSIIFKFNYTLNRELYEIQPSRPNHPMGISNMKTRANIHLDNGCTNGEYYHDNTAGSRTLQLCTSANTRTYFETTDVVAIECRYLCPTPPGEFIKQTFVRQWSNATQWPEGRMPLPGQNVTVNGNWTIIMDVDPAACQFLTIDGDVIIQDVDRNITCDSIWIRAGSLNAGNASVPFQSKLTIQVNGERFDPGYVFDETLAANKVFVVTGKLNLYGISPATVSAKLTNNALAGDSTIQVSSVSGWKVGDEIGLAPSFFKSREYEKLTITGISGNVVTFTPALKYDHYGDASVTINNNYGTLDTRASVGHITRNIKIVSGPDAGWGYSLIVYQYWQKFNALQSKERSGVAVFSGVQFTLGGKYDTQSASLILNNNFALQTNTIVTGSSFADCRSSCIKAFSHSGATIKNNFFFQARKFHIKLLDIANVDVDSNLMIGAIIRPTITGKQPVACVELTKTDPGTSLVFIKNNVCQGSDLNGYVLPFIACSQIDNSPFVNNLVGTALQVGFLLNRDSTELCLAFAGVRAYACRVGVISSPPSTAQLQIKNYIVADSKLGVVLRFGMEGTDRALTFSDSYITQISRPSCTICYGNNKIGCSSNSALRAFTVTINGETYPTSYDAGFDVICKHEAFDAKAFIKNVVFDSYRQNYSEANLAQCSKNVVLTTHPSAADLVGGHYFWNSSCTNCQFEAMAIFDPPKLSDLGWSGGCGNITCTGKKNYFLMDHTATLFPGGGVLLPSNKQVGDNIPECTYISEMNGHHCKRSDFATLAYENIAPDFNTRIMWPVNLTYDGGNWTTVTNGYREWQWEGKQPLNKRLGRFITTLLLGKTYNMTFASNPPDDMRVMLQKRNPGGNNAEWIIVKLYYPFPNSIEVSVNGQVQKPISLLDNNGEGPLDTTKCGSNKFFYKNYTIHFVVTNSKDCLIRVRLTNAIQLTLRFAVDVNSFFSTNGPTRLVDRICAIFNITDQSRVKIVGVYTGSTAVSMIISTANNGSTTANVTDTQEVIALNEKAKNLYEQGVLTKETAVIGQLIAMSSNLLPVRPLAEDTPENDDDMERKIIIGVSVSIAAVVLIVTAIIIYIKKTANNKVSEELPQISSQASDKAKSNEKAVHETIEVQNITEENISEVIFEKTH